MKARTKTSAGWGRIAEGLPIRLFPFVASLTILSGQVITGVSPESTLLAPGTQSIVLTVTTARPTACGYAHRPAELAAMTPFAEGNGTTRQRATVANLSPDPAVVNHIYVRCAADPAVARELVYRALAPVNPPFPRTGNLWGYRLLLDKGIQHAARVDLHLGSDYTPEQIRGLRQLNPHILLLTSINAVDADPGTVPEDFYLKDVRGKRIEVWPGSFRLNLTKPGVAEFQARMAYNVILKSGMLLDGCFFDNFMTAQSWLKEDIHGNRVEMDADEDGKPDDPRILDARWRAGLFRELQEWRKLMPHAYAIGHLPRPPDEDTQALFNGDSIGFLTAEVLEGKTPFSKLWDLYNSWFAQGRKPTLMMLESAPPWQISYGYGFFPIFGAERAPASTLEFARTYYPYVRFGLGLALMNDGYFAHEFGDTFHGNDWWYDELDFRLGYPIGPAQVVQPQVVQPQVAQQETNSRRNLLEDAHDWQFYAAGGTKASWTRDATNAKVGKSSSRVDIIDPGQGIDWQVNLYRTDLRLTRGTVYEVMFWARADRSRPLTVVMNKSVPDWRNYGLEQTLTIGTDWRQYAVSFNAKETASDGRLQFMLGQSRGSVWLNEVQLRPAPSNVYRRDFTNGAVLLNPNSSPQTIVVGPGYRRLQGQQAARFESIIDDTPDTFHASDGWQTVSYDSGMFKPKGPYFHAWGKFSHRCAGINCEPADWSVPIAEDGAYSISAWWPAAPEALRWTHQAVYELIQDGRVIASKMLDQSSGGDQWHELFQAVLSRPGATVRLRNTGSAAAIADALWIKSAARYNDGSPASSVTLQPFDAIILRKQKP